MSSMFFQGMAWNCPLLDNQLYEYVKSTTLHTDFTVSSWVACATWPAGNGARSGSGAGFNPFGLPSPSFASPVPVTADNRFADVSPMADAPPPSVPAPMRVSPYALDPNAYHSNPAVETYTCQGLLFSVNHSNPMQGQT